MSDQQKFIDTIAPYIQKYAKVYGFGVPSVIIGQACYESGYGTSTKAQHNNFFGLKYRIGRVLCNNGIFHDGSKEEVNGEYVPIVTDWYTFDTMEKGVEGYFQFIANGPYAPARAVNQTDVNGYLTALKKCEYASDSSYVKEVTRVINDWNLTKYDKTNTEVKPVSYNFFDLCNAKSISFSSAKRALNSIQYIVLHYTGNTTDTAKANCNFFAQSNTREAGAHYFVDETSVYHSISDDRAAWAVGGSKYGTCATTGGGKFYNRCSNFNSVSIEMCSTNGKISEATINNAIELTKSLMAKYSVPVSNVIRHFDVTGKACPGWNGWGTNGGAAPIWDNFKARLTSNAVSSNVPIKETVTSNPSTIKRLWEGKVVKIASNDVLWVRNGPGASYSKHAEWDHLRLGNHVDVIEETRASDGGKWYKVYIAAGKTYGYVNANYISKL